MKLGKLIEELKKYPKDHPVTIPGGPVQLSPERCMSYRGYYDQLAIGVGTHYATVGSLLQELKEAVGATFTGYKGGEYTMGLDTCVWLSNYGESSGSLITGVRKVEVGGRCYGVELIWMDDQPHNSGA